MKVSDEFTIPLCRTHHRNLHQAGNELTWWEKASIDPLPIARKLWEETHPGRGSQEDRRKLNLRREQTLDAHDPDASHQAVEQPG